MQLTCTQLEKCSASARRARLTTACSRPPSASPSQIINGSLYRGPEKNPYPDMAIHRGVRSRLGAAKTPSLASLARGALCRTWALPDFPSTTPTRCRLQRTEDMLLAVLYLWDLPDMEFKLHFGDGCPQEAAAFSEWRVNARREGEQGEQEAATWRGKALRCGVRRLERVPAPPPRRLHHAVHHGVAERPGPPSNQGAHLAWAQLHCRTLGVWRGWQEGAGAKRLCAHRSTTRAWTTGTPWRAAGPWRSGGAPTRTTRWWTASR